MATNLVSTLTEIVQGTFDTEASSKASDSDEEYEDDGGEDEYEEEEDRESNMEPSDTYDDTSAGDEEEELAYADQPAAGLSPRLVIKRAVKTLQVLAPQGPLHDSCINPACNRPAERARVAGKRP